MSMVWLGFNEEQGTPSIVPRGVRDSLSLDLKGSFAPHLNDSCETDECD
jgi:hypothetical protein